MGVERDDERDAEMPLGLTEERFVELRIKINKILTSQYTPAQLVYALGETCDTPAEALLMAIGFCM